MERRNLILAALFIIAACCYAPEATPASLIFLPMILIAIIEDVIAERRRK